jgi:hypothetical protein
MGIMQTDRTLPTNRLIFEVRKDPVKRTRLLTDLEGLMSEYGLGNAEKAALRQVDLRRLADLGVHPYFLPQLARLFKGAGYNHNDSAAARLYAEKMTERSHG